MHYSVEIHQENIREMIDTHGSQNYFFIINGDCPLGTQLAFPCFFLQDSGRNLAVYSTVNSFLLHGGKASENVHCYGNGKDLGGC